MDDDWSYLCGTNGDLEAEMIQGFLREQGIPTVKRYSENAQVMKIYSGSGAVDIYVPSPDREVALDLLNGTNMELNMEQKKPAGEISPAAGMKPDTDIRSGAGSVAAIIIIVFLALVLFLTLLIKDDFFFTK